MRTQAHLQKTGEPSRAILRNKDRRRESPGHPSFEKPVNLGSMFLFRCVGPKGSTHGCDRCGVD
jgi:hypothetical protein